MEQVAEGIITERILAEETTGVAEEITEVAVAEETTEVAAAEEITETITAILKRDTDRLKRLKRLKG